MAFLPPSFHKKVHLTLLQIQNFVSFLSCFLNNYAEQKDDYLGLELIGTILLNKL